MSREPALQPARMTGPPAPRAGGGWRVALLAALVASLLGACREVAPRAAPAPPPDERVALGQPKATVREGAGGAPVACTVDVSNRVDRPVRNLVIGCELLDAQGVSLGVGLTSLDRLQAGDTKSVRAVVYGVRSFADARAFVSSLDVQ